MNKAEFLSKLESGIPFNINEEWREDINGADYLDLDFSYDTISDEEAEKIVMSIESGCLPDRVEICLEGATISQPLINRLINAFTSTHAPKNATTYFYEGTGVNPQTIMTISNAISSGKLAEGIEFCFHRGTAFSNEAIEDLGNALITGRYPKDFSLSFASVFGETGLSEGRLFDMLKGAKHLGPNASSLKINDDDFGDEDSSNHEKPLQKVINEHAKKWFDATKDVRLGARILSQGKRSEVSPMFNFPDEILVYIASLASDLNSHNHNLQLALKFFSRPQLLSTNDNEQRRLLSNYTFFNQSRDEDQSQAWNQCTDFCHPGFKMSANQT